MYSKAEKRFLRINLISIISLFLLIFAGGIVRSSGSGMGCPDWPKCFNQYIPPTDISQLPADYKQKYVAQRIKKNEHFATLLDKAGYQDLAHKIRNDETIKVPEEFNSVKTYTEYINRLIGALTGVFLLLTFIFAIPLRKINIKLFWFSIVNILLVVFQAWLGSIVVSTNLVAWIITVHMLIAIIILAISIYTYHEAKVIRNEYLLTNKASVMIKFTAVLALVVSVIQITIGTEVREGIDAVKTQFPELARGEWLSEVGRIFTHHKDLALFVILINGILFFLLKKKFQNNRVIKVSNFLLLFILLQIFTGVILNYFDLAAWAQAPHILFATLMFGTQFYLLLLLKGKSLKFN